MMLLLMAWVRQWLHEGCSLLLRRDLIHEEALWILKIVARDEVRSLIHDSLLEVNLEHWNLGCLLLAGSWSLVGNKLRLAHCTRDVW
jgi:hypothetical protein